MQANFQVTCNSFCFITACNTHRLNAFFQFIWGLLDTARQFKYFVFIDVQGVPMAIHVTVEIQLQNHSWNLTYKSYPFYDTQSYNNERCESTFKTSLIFNGNPCTNPSRHLSLSCLMETPVQTLQDISHCHVRWKPRHRPFQTSLTVMFDGNPCTNPSRHLSLSW